MEPFPFAFDIQHGVEGICETALMLVKQTKLNSKADSFRHGLASLHRNDTLHDVWSSRCEFPTEATILTHQVVHTMYTKLVSNT